MSQQPITIDDIYALFRTSQEELREDFRISREEYDRQFTISKAESDRSMEELKKSVAETTRAVNALTSRWGRFVEELVEPAVVRLFRERGIDVKEKHPRVSSERLDVPMEIDILVVNTTSVVLVECKSRLSTDDVNDFIENLQKFKLAFPAYKNYQVYGAMAGIEINDGVDRNAYQRGLFVIRPSGDTVKIVNDEKFRAKLW
jgi:hypothetical protein